MCVCQQGFYAYLFSVGIAFLCFVQFFIIQTKTLTFLAMIRARFMKPRDRRRSRDDKRTTKKISVTMHLRVHTGSFYLRLGAVGNLLSVFDFSEPWLAGTLVFFSEDRGCAVYLQPYITFQPVCIIACSSNIFFKFGCESCIFEIKVKKLCQNCVQRSNIWNCMMKKE